MNRLLLFAFTSVTLFACQTENPDNGNYFATVDQVTTLEDTAVTFRVLDNDELDSDITTFTIQSQHTFGQVVINTDRSITYTPKENYYGNDSFSYRVTTENEEEYSATVELIVLPDTPVESKVLFPMNNSVLIGSDTATVTLEAQDTDDGVLETEEIINTHVTNKTYTFTQSNELLTYRDIAVDLGTQSFDVGFTTNDDVQHAHSITYSRKNFITSLRAATFDLDSRTAYLLDSDERQLWKHDLDTNNRTLVSGPDVGTGPALSGATKIGFIGDDIFVAKTTSIMRLDLSTGNREEITGFTVGSGAPIIGIDTATLSQDESTFYVIVDRTLYTADVATGFRTEIQTYAGNYITALVHDADRDRLLVTSSESDSIGAIDLSDPAAPLTVLSSSGIGTGTNFSNPNAISLNALGTVAYVTDNATDTVVHVDLTNGNRTTISDNSINSEITMSGAKDLMVDFDNDLGYYVDPSRNNAIVEVSLLTGKRAALSHSAVGEGDFVLFSTQNMFFDKSSNALFVFRFNPSEVIKINLDNLNKTILSSSSVGAGLDFDLINDGLVTNGETMLVVDRDLGALLNVDLETGDRSIFSDASTGGGQIFRSPSTIKFDVANNRYLVSDPGLPAIIGVDAATGDRTVISGLGIGTGDSLNAPVHLAINADGTKAYVSDIESSIPSYIYIKVIEIDLDTGSRRTIAQYDTISDTGSIGDGEMGEISDLEWNAERNALVGVSWGNDNYATYEINLETGNRTGLLSRNYPDGTNLFLFDSIQFDEDNQRWYIYDDLLNAIVAVNTIDLDNPSFTIIAK